MRPILLILVVAWMACCARVGTCQVSRDPGPSLSQGLEGIIQNALQPLPSLEQDVRSLDGFLPHGHGRAETLDRQKPSKPQTGPIPTGPASRPEARRERLAPAEVLTLAHITADLTLALNDLSDMPPERALQFAEYWASDKFVDQATRLYRKDLERRISEALPQIAESTQRALVEGFVRSAREAFAAFSTSVAEEIPHLRRIHRLQSDPTEALAHPLFKTRFQEKWPLWAAPAGVNHPPGR